MKKVQILAFLAFISMYSFAQGASEMMSKLINEGKLSERTGNYKEAEEAYMSALTIDSNSAEVHVLLGKLYHSTNNYNLAAKELDKAIELDAHNADAYFVRGNLNTDLGNNNLAVSDYTLAIQNDPALMEAYMRRGFVSAQMGLYENATKDFAIAIQVDREEAIAYYNFIRIQGAEMLQNNCTYAQSQVSLGNAQADLVISTFCF